MSFTQGAASPPGYGSISQGYSYANPLGQQPQTPPVRNPVSGASSIADALINGYFSNPANQAQSGQAPMQLSGAAPGNFLSALFSGANTPAANSAMPNGVY